MLNVLPTGGVMALLIEWTSTIAASAIFAAGVFLSIM